MKTRFSLFLVICLVMLYCGCSKQAPYINSITGTYKVSGALYIDSAFTRTFTDTLITITKTDNQTIQFISGSCDTALITLPYTSSWENDSVIEYINTSVGDHSPDGTSLFFRKPPDSTFTCFGEYYCGNTISWSFSGVRVR